MDHLRRSRQQAGFLRQVWLKSRIVNHLKTLVGPRILMLKNEVGILFQSRIFQVMLAIPAFYFGFKTIGYLKMKYVKSESAPS